MMIQEMFQEKLEKLQSQTKEQRRAVEEAANNLLKLPAMKDYAKKLAELEKSIQDSVRTMPLRSDKAQGLQEYAVIQYVYNQQLNILGRILKDVEKDAGI